MDLALLFIVFNRPETSSQVFEAIRQARPSRLYLAADGPREGCDDTEKIDRVREIVSEVDWPCDVKTLFRSHNLGCKHGPASAITWFFEHEGAGVILEDDCLPHPDFFHYCVWALKFYEEKKSVWHINGNNFGAAEELWGDEELAFSALAQVWGWATWKDRWQHFVSNPFYVAESARKHSSKWQLSRLARQNKLLHLQALEQGLDAWDYQWQVAILNAQGLCLTSKSNLISNIGNGADATHTRDDKRTHLTTASLVGELRTVELQNNMALTEWYEGKMGLRKKRSLIKSLGKKSYTRLKLKMRFLLTLVLFKGVKPVVVSSVGRSGSTMLCRALADSLVQERFGLSPDSWLAKRLSNLAITYESRLDNIKYSGSPIIKTHDLRRDGGESRNCVFVFCDPVVSLKSAQSMQDEFGDIWLEQHVYHLVGRGTPAQLCQRDILNYRAQLESWSRPVSKNILVLKYDHLWQSEQDLSKLVCYEVCLPEREERKPKVLSGQLNEELFRELQELYEAQ